MSLEQAIHEHWQTGTQLVALLPEEKFFTGLARPAVSPPYGTLERQPAGDRLRTSTGGNVETTRATFRIWDADLDRAEAVAAALVAHFAGVNLTWNGGRTLDFKLANSHSQSQDDGTWQIAIEYTVRILYN
jgi:hypothetical protein